MTAAIVLTLLIIVPSSMLLGALIERRRAHTAWREATDQAVALTRTIHREDS